MFYYQITLDVHIFNLISTKDEFLMNAFSHETYIQCEQMIVRDTEGRKSWCPTEIRIKLIRNKHQISEEDASVIITQLETGLKNAWGVEQITQIHKLKQGFVADLKNTKPMLDEYYMFSDKVKKNPIDILIEKYDI